LWLAGRPGRGAGRRVSEEGARRGAGAASTAGCNGAVLG
jgi:hypothetical protein